MRQKRLNSANNDEDYMTCSDFIHLRVHSAYSLAEGAIKMPRLMQLCQDNNMPAVAVTDTGNMFGALELSLGAVKAGVQPILGCQITVTRPGIDPSDPNAQSLMDEPDQLIVLVQDEVGYKNLLKLTSASYMEIEENGTVQITWEKLEQHTDGLICLTAGPKGAVGRLLSEGQDDKAADTLIRLQKFFGDRLYIELLRHGTIDETRIEDRLIDLAYAHNIPLVATNNCFFPTKDMYSAHDALLCISDGRYITEDNRRKVTPEHYFKSADEMKELFKDLPEAIENTVLIAKRCSYILKPIDPILPRFDTQKGRSEEDQLRHQTETGLQWRLEEYVFTPEMSEDEKAEKVKTYNERMEYEIGILNKMGFAGYFLIVADFIQWAKDQDIPVGPGRGSGAGSIVAWAMKITDLDPMAFDLLFERFLNPERISMPDFDIDFCQERREEVISYVQNKYGYDRVGQIITFGKLQARAVVRDVGRVLQMSYGQVDKIAKLVPSNPANPISLQEALDSEEQLRDAIKANESVKNLIDIALQLEGLYRHASTHAAGVVIGDRPLDELVPMYRDPRSPMPVTQYNMKYVEQAGLVKFDFLGLKTLSVIKNATNFIKETVGKDIDPLKFPLDDKKTLKMLARGDTTAVFQIESAGMRDLSIQMKISNFDQIMAVVALYRPGPMENIPKYLACLNGEQERDYMHPSLEPILKPTYGVMIYQEQVMQTARTLAGYTMGGADILRKAMGKKIKSEMDAQREVFVKGAVANDVDAEQAGLIYDQVAKFAGYGFNKAHTAAYALISYQTAYLKAYYPVEFMAATLNYDLGNTDKLGSLRQAIVKMKIPLLLPDVNKSYPRFTVEELEDGTLGIRYALGALKGVGEEAMEALVKEREDNGLFKDLHDFSERLSNKVMNKKQLEGLACSGSFGGMNDNRADVQAAIPVMLKYASSLAQERESGQSSLFGDDTTALAKPKFDPQEKWESMELLKREFMAVGFYLSAHPLDQMETQLERLRVTSSAGVARKLRESPSSRVRMAGIVLKKQEKTSIKSGNRFAFVTLSDSSGVYECICFSEVLATYRDLLVPGQAVLISADADMQGEDDIRYLIQSIEPLEEKAAQATQEVEITLNSDSAVQSLKTLCDERGTGRIRVRLCVITQDKQTIKMALPGGYGISPDDVRSIRKIDGVLEVAEK